MSERGRLAAVATTMAIVLAGAVSLALQASSGVGPIGAGEFLLLVVLVSPPLLLVPLTRRWRIWPWVTALAVVGWLPLIGPGGNTSCTDCAFVLLLPINTGLIQLILFVAARLGGDARYR